ncbi:MAG TPA: thiamine pyrophosphate-dependent enzyme [Clostridia bacterium]|nr:thiamine pyrophosphate-dependent enzyme [Clostridia bacterium]
MALTLKNLPDEEFVALGRAGCPGCPAVVGARMVSKVLKDKSIMVNSTGCMCVNYGYAGATKFPYVHSLFPNAAAVASGIDSALKARGERDDINLYVYAGDGGTVDIGIQALSGAVDRGHRFLYICYDNEGYMNTGSQRSGATPFKARTSTTPVGEIQAGEPRQLSKRKDMVGIMAAHGIPYTATASLAYPLDFMRKVEHAIAIDGPTYIHLHSPCMVGWSIGDDMGIEVSRLAVQTRINPLYEVHDGKDYRITLDVKKPLPIEEYLKVQGRFKHLFVGDHSEEIALMQADVDRNWAHLQALASKCKEA